jgi:5'-nucleotidase
MVEEVYHEGTRLGFAVDGKPADCVKLGLVQLLDHRPDLVVSGINAGSNAGINILYSGTVAAAVEGAFDGMTSIAVSLQTPQLTHYDSAAKIAVQVIQQILEHRPEPGELFNVNIPELTPGPPIGVRVAQQGLISYRECYEPRNDPRGRRYYWLLPDPLRGGDAPETDLAALAARYVTVTPLHFDLTDRRRLADMEQWRWEL